MTDDEIQATINRHWGHAGGAADDLVRFAAEIDRQRQLATQLADQSQRLRAVVEGRGKVLEKIKVYAEEAGKASPDQFTRFALGTICGMVRQCMDVERTCEVQEGAK